MRRSVLDLVLVGGAWLGGMLGATTIHTRITACAVSSFGASATANAINDAVLSCSEAGRWLFGALGALVLLGFAVVKLVDRVDSNALDSDSDSSGDKPSDPVATATRAVLLGVAGLWGGAAGLTHLLTLRAATTPATVLSTAYDLLRPLLGALCVALVASALVDEWRARRDRSDDRDGDGSAQPRRARQ